MRAFDELAERPPHAAALAARSAVSERRWRTTVGLKVLMAATGVVLVAFLAFHLLGNLLVYRGPAAVGEISPDMSFLDMLDTLNEQLASKGEAPVAFESDCREGICGSCGVMINGAAHGPIGGTTVCQLYMRHFAGGDMLVIEPWRARGFPVLKDLIVDRSAFDRIIGAGGFISAPTGAAPEASSALIPKHDTDAAMDSAACIGCGACVAACPNGSAALFTGAKIAHLGLLSQGQPERAHRALAMVTRMDDEGFGNCSWHGECQAACPKSISIDTIARMNRDWLRASLNAQSVNGVDRG